MLKKIWTIFVLVEFILPIRSMASSTSFFRSMASPSFFRSMASPSWDGVEKVVFETSDKLTSLKIGAPGDDLLAKSKEVIRLGAEKTLEPGNGNEAPLFNYGVEEGPTSFLSNLSQLLTEGYQDEVLMEELMLTSSASAGLFYAVARLVSQNGTAYVESPTYFLASKVIADLGFNSDRVVPIPMTSDGLDVDYLENQLKSQQNKEGASDGDRYSSFLYTIPVHHNPTGVTLSAAKSQKLVKLSRQFDFLIIADDVYNLLSYSDGPPPKRLVELDKKAKGKRSVISNGSFSKILAPGSRLGWYETSPEIKSRMVAAGVLVSGGSLNTLMAGIVSSSMGQGVLKKNIDSLKATFKERMSKVSKALQECLPETFKVSHPKGGYFIWVTGPDDFNATSFNDLCKSKYGVEVLPGADCASLTDEGIQASNATPTELARMSARNSFRIAISFHQKQVLLDAVQQICTALQETDKSSSDDKDKGTTKKTTVHICFSDC